MTGRKKYPRHALSRMTVLEHEALRHRAKRSNLSLSRYLVAAGLSDGDPLSQHELEQRERALFRLRKSGADLDRIANAFSRQKEVPPPVLEEALRAHARAAEAVLAAYERSNR